MIDIDLYAILEIDKKATSEMIKKSFRQLSKIHHPDVGGNPAKFAELHEAYEILMDPIKRELYDTSGLIINESEEQLRTWIQQTFHDMAKIWISAKINQPSYNVPFVQYFTSKVNENKQCATENINELRSKKQQTKKYASFASVDSGNNIFANAVQSIISDINNEIKQASMIIHKSNLLLREFKKYKFENDAEVISFFMGSTTTTFQSGGEFIWKRR